MLLRLAWRELLHGWRFGLFFIFNLSLGLAGFISLQAFNVALAEHIQMNAKSFLSADIAVTARRELSATEIQKIDSVLPKESSASKVYEFFAMLSSKQGSRLVMVKGIDAVYPFYGQLRLKSGAIIKSSSKKEIIGSKKIWISPELRSQLGLKIGDEIKIGNLNLNVADLVDVDASQTFRSGSLAPRVYISREFLPQSGLLQYGSTFSVAYLYKLPEGQEPAIVKDNLYKQLSDPQINVETPTSAGEDAGRQSGYLSDYLSLVAIVAIFLSALGAAYIYRLFLSMRMKEIAILRTLGLQSGGAIAVYVIQATILGFLAIIPTLGFSYLILPFLNKLLSSITPFELHPKINMQIIFIALIMAVFSSLIVSLPFLYKIFDLKTAKLFNEEKFSAGEGKIRPWLFLPAIILFYLLSVYQSHSWKTGSIFSITMVIVILMLSAAGFATVKAAGLLKTFNAWSLKYSFLSLSRRAGASLALFIALGSGALLINILPQLKNSLEGEFKFDKKSKIPSLFMFDIQDEQLPQLESFLKKSQVPIQGISPLVRSRIVKVNGREFERALETKGFRTREEEREARFRNRGVNLSYRNNLSESETITEGKPFSGVFDPTKQHRAELSVEHRFAQRLGFHIGDVVTFDVQGIEVEGEIINFRKVKWTSFQPNFFILMQDGVLNDAPKSFIAALSSLSEVQKNQLQNEMAQKFPNVSIVDVARTVSTTLETAEQMSWSLQLMSVLAVITGYVVLFSIVRSQIKLRRWELNMLKVLGASWQEVSKFILWEFAFLAFLAALCGALLSIVASFSINKFIFESEFILSWSQPLFSVLIITVLSLFISFFASIDIVKESALSILREENN